jgi:hypothetical protein
VTSPLFLPAQMAASGAALPDLCQRHGRPAVKRVKARFVSPLPVWTYLLLLAGFLPFVIVAEVTRKRIDSLAWPVCASCLQVRRRNLAVAGVLAVAMFGALFLGSAVAVLVVEAALFVGLVVVLSRLQWNVIAAADVTRDGIALRLRQPFSGYERALPPPPTSGQPLGPSGTFLPTR